ncbi:MAG TPA: hypothetical protein VFP92_10580 [Rhodanobacteraceae bacterium]|nr:hypothetical protein [Rhodanobacteraceae bacterium]
MNSNALPADIENVLRTLESLARTQYQRDAAWAVRCALTYGMLDTRRIDWLANMDNKVGNVQLPRECVEPNIHSLRAAIDAAMEIRHD